MKLAFTSLAYPELTLSEVLERVRRFGFDGLELRVAEDGQHLKPIYPVPRQELELIKSSGVKLSNLSGYASFAMPNDQERARNEELLRVLILIARELEAPGVRVYGGRVTDDVDKAAERIITSLNRVVKFAEDNGVAIMMETHDDWVKASNLRKLLRGLDEGVGILLDFANVVAAGEDLDNVLELVKGRVKHVHVKNFKLVNGKIRYTIPDDPAGLVPIRKVVDYLRGIGFQGYLSVEWEKKWHPELEPGDEILPKYLSYLRSIIKT
ncbi:sugar phosphate isomerase/epimerase family protein [Caldivirga sp. UBA161]|uniref:sugar phosphate isomerase/epimerase family protein n=1 Tax=Caldivirga sp. UBA161 TaxID=1915569 RepID=UPI0025C15B59|nr:sugar phosphate isomerase/epimerase family protein [Caldivirga sp. UBA161]